VRVVVTGAAGFIGSHVAEAMNDAGHEVLAVDALARSTCPEAAARNWTGLSRRRGITLVEADLVTADLGDMAEADVIVHLAGRPGVRTSWSDADVNRDNVRATRRLLAACTARPPARRPRVVVASSSSVYGSATRPCREDAAPRPESPYGAAKVAVERLAAEAARREVRTVILRFFSVYGPRQRPDMAFHRFIEAALGGAPAPVFGDGTQVRAFTYIDDVVRATVRAATAPLPAGTVLNVGHRATVPLALAISRIAALVGGRPLRLAYTAAVAGDVERTWATTSRAADLLGWTAGIGLDEGLARQIAWHRASRREPVSEHVGA
jgi:nucleoside-diphosphate-sugar epimerase